MIRTAPLWTMLLCSVALCSPERALSQDAGEDDLMTPMDGGDLMSLPEGGMSMDGGVVLHPACSCETATVRGGMIHLCTGSNDRDTCKRFTCNEAGNPRADNCPTDNVQLCCEMKARHLYSQLYEDCTHPSCVSGFRKQCEIFGGEIREGACEVLDNPDPDTDLDLGSDGCTVNGFNRTLAKRTGLSALLSVLALLAWRRKRRALVLGA